VKQAKFLDPAPSAGKPALLRSTLLCLIALLIVACAPESDTQRDNAPPGTFESLQSEDVKAPQQDPQSAALNSPLPLNGKPARIKPLTEAQRLASGTDALILLDQIVAAGTSARLMWAPSQIFEGMSTETPVLVINGHKPGPTVCLTAAIHGDELNGIEMVRRVLHDINPKELNGAIIGVPIVNLQGFRRNSRYLPDRRDLNRYFPGNPLGSSASRIANSLFTNIISHCDALVDLHTGSFYRTNLPQLRADLRYTKIKNLTNGFGGIVILHSVAAPGTLRRAATDAGIPTVTLEAGEPSRLQSTKVNEGVRGVYNLLGSLKMIKRVSLLNQPGPVFYESTWVRADHGGILFGVVRLGQEVESGDVLGTITDPITNEQNLIYSPAPGRILGMALNQVVMPGFAAFRIGIESDGPPSDQANLDTGWDDADDAVSGEPAPSSSPEQLLDSESAPEPDPLEESSEE